MKNKAWTLYHATLGLPHPKKTMIQSHANTGVPYIHYLSFLW